MKIYLTESELIELINEYVDYRETLNESVYKDSGLGKWFKEKWVNISKKKNDGGYEECGRSNSDKGGYPKCLPKSKASKLSDKERNKLINRKRNVEKSNKRVDKKPNYTSSKINK